MAKAKSDDSELLHSVAFRVTEEHWLILKKRAEQEGTTIAQLARLALFERAGIKDTTTPRRPYGHDPRRKRN